MTRVVAIAAFALLLLLLAVLGLVALRGNLEQAEIDCGDGVAIAGGTAIGGPFTLTDGAKARVTDSNVVKGPTLIYFGYSFCPDICPTDMARNAMAVDLLKEQGIATQLVFITIDPDRDTPETADAFARSIHPDAIGLSGSAEDIAAVAKEYRVYFRKAGEDPDFYLMDHSTFTYLAEPGRPFVTFYRSDATPEAVADSVACHMGKADSRKAT